VEVGRLAGRHSDATERIILHRIDIGLVAQADVEDTGHDCVDLILLVSVWHQLQAGGHFDPAGRCGCDRRWDPAPGRSSPDPDCFAEARGSQLAKSRPPPTPPSRS
jgi:hypothetical protein